MGTPWLIALLVVSAGLLVGIFWPRGEGEGFDGLAQFYFRMILVTVLGCLWLLFWAARVWGGA